VLFTPWIADSDQATKIIRDPYGSEAVITSVADTHHFDADPDPACHIDPDPDPACLFDADPDSHLHRSDKQDPDPSFQIKAQNLVKVLK
jgi:hypothetical protein